MRIHLVCRFLPALLFVAASAWSSEDPAGDALRFGEALHAEGDYYRAITEYKRAAFLAPGTEVALKAHLGIGRAYREGQKWESAAEAFRKAGEAGELELADTWRMAGEDAAARDAYRTFLSHRSEGEEADRARLGLAACLARLGAYDEALEALAKVPEGSPHAAKARDAGNAIRARPDFQPKSPRLAGAMSAVIPGTGQWYAGRPMGGAVYFLLNAALIGGTVEAFQGDQDALGGLLGVAALTVYAANIFGAAGDAHKANLEAEEGWLGGLERGLGVAGPPELPPRSAGLEGRPPAAGIALVWSVRF